MGTEAVRSRARRARKRSRRTSPRKFATAGLGAKVSCAKVDAAGTRAQMDSAAQNQARGLPRRRNPPRPMFSPLPLRRQLLCLAPLPSPVLHPSLSCYSPVPSPAPHLLSD